MMWSDTRMPPAERRGPLAPAPRGCASHAGGGKVQPPCPPAPDLHEERDGVEAEDLHAVHGVPGQDVQCPRAPLHDLFHLHSVLPGDKRSAGALKQPVCPTPGHETTLSVVASYPPRTARLLGCRAVPGARRQRATPGRSCRGDSPCRAAACRLLRAAGHPGEP